MIQYLSMASQNRICPKFISFMTRMLLTQFTIIFYSLDLFVDVSGSQETRKLNDKINDEPSKQV